MAFSINIKLHFVVSVVKECPSAFAAVVFELTLCDDSPVWVPFLMGAIPDSAINKCLGCKRSVLVFGADKSLHLLNIVQSRNYYEDKS